MNGIVKTLVDCRLNPAVLAGDETHFGYFPTGQAYHEQLEDFNCCKVMTALRSEIAETKSFKVTVEVAEGKGKCESSRKTKKRGSRESDVHTLPCGDRR
jgi:hypothetical protein